MSKDKDGVAGFISLTELFLESNSKLMKDVKRAIDYCERLAALENKGEPNSNRAKKIFENLNGSFIEDIFSNPGLPNAATLVKLLLRCEFIDVTTFSVIGNGNEGAIKLATQLNDEEIFRYVLNNLHNCDITSIRNRHELLVLTSNPDIQRIINLDFDSHEWIVVDDNYSVLAGLFLDCDKKLMEKAIAKVKSSPDSFTEGDETGLVHYILYNPNLENAHKLLELLLKEGVVDVNSPVTLPNEEKGELPLKIAIELANRDLIRILLSYGADITCLGTKEEVLNIAPNNPDMIAIIEGEFFRDDRPGSYIGVPNPHKKGKFIVGEEEEDEDEDEEDEEDQQQEGDEVVDTSADDSSDDDDDEAGSPNGYSGDGGDDSSGSENGGSYEDSSADETDDTDEDDSSTADDTSEESTDDTSKESLALISIAIKGNKTADNEVMPAFSNIEIAVSGFGKEVSAFEFLAGSGGHEVVGDLLQEALAF